MIEEIKSDLSSCLAQEGRILKTTFSLLSAEALYYTYLNKRMQRDNKSQSTSAGTSSGNRHHQTIRKEKQPMVAGKQVNNSSSSSCKDDRYNSKKSKDIQNKNKLFYNFLAEEYSIMKLRNDCEEREGQYQAVVTGVTQKLSKIDKNHTNSKKQVQKGKDKDNNHNTNMVIMNNAKNTKSKSKGDASNKTNVNTTDTIKKAAKKFEQQLLMCLASDYRLMKWKKKREKAEGRFQKYLANKKKKEFKKEQSMWVTKQTNGSGGTSTSLDVTAQVPKHSKRFSKKKMYAVQKSLGYDYRHCLKKKRNREDDECVYQRFLTGVIITSSVSTSTSVSKAVLKVAASKTRYKNTHLTFVLANNKEEVKEKRTSVELAVMQSLILETSRMSLRWRCEVGEANYQTLMGLKEKNNIKL